MVASKERRGPLSFPDMCAKALSTHPVRMLPVSRAVALVRASEEPEHPYQGLVDFQGIMIHLENKRGSVRSGKGWRTKMRHHYGEIRGTKGADGDAIDCYVGPNNDAHRAVVVHQKVPGERTYDEDKVMLGFDSVSEALRSYREHYDRPGFYGQHTSMSIPELKRWLYKRGKAGKRIAKGFLGLVEILKARKPAPGQFGFDFGPATTATPATPAATKPAEPRPAAAPATTATTKVAIVEGKTKKGKPIFVAKEPGRLDRDAWTARRDQAKDAGGWWSREHNGWAFRSKDKAQGFASSSMGGKPATAQLQPVAAKPKGRPTAAQRRAEIHAGKRPDGAGWGSIPKGKRGGFRRRKKAGKGWEHWYPQHPKWTAHRREGRDKASRWTLAGGNLQITDTGSRGGERFEVTQKLPRFVGARESGVEWSEASTHATLEDARAAANKYGEARRQTVEGVRRVAAMEEEARQKKMAQETPAKGQKAGQRKADVELAGEAHDVASKYTRWLKEQDIPQLGRSSSKIMNLRSVAVRLNSGKGGEGDRQEARRAVEALKKEMAAEPKPSVPAPLVTAKLDDIPKQAAEAAHRHTSFSPERRGEQIRTEYVQHIEDVEKRLARRAKTPEQREELREELKRYKTAYRSKLMGVLEAKSRTASPMITGPSKFPTGRNRKRMATEAKRTEELLDWSKRTVTRIGNKVDPQTISADRGDDAVAALKDKIDKAEKLQATMKAANRVIRGKKLSDDQKLTKLSGLGIKGAGARALIKPDRWGKVVGFEGYQLTNNNANIRRMKQRVAALETELSHATTEHEFDGGTVIDNAESNRVEIHYDGKPDAETIRDLKSEGFRWSRTKGAWQRQRSNRARWLAGKFTGVDLPSPEAAEKSFVSLWNRAKAHQPRTRGAAAGADPSPGRLVARPPGEGFVGLVDMLKAAKPPGAGWQSIPGGKHGGFRRPKGGGWEHWYPDGGKARAAGKHHAREAKRAQRQLARHLRSRGAKGERMMELLGQHEQHAATAHSTKVQSVRMEATRRGAKVQAQLTKKLKAAGASDEEIKSVLRDHAHHSGMAAKQEGAKAEAPEAAPVAGGEEPKAAPKTFPELVQQALSDPKVVAAIEDAVQRAGGKPPEATPEKPAEKPQAAPKPEAAPEAPKPAEKPPEQKDVDVRPKRTGKPLVITREMDAHRQYLERQLGALKQATPEERAKSPDLPGQLKADIDRLKRGDDGPIKEHKERVKAVTDMMEKMARTKSPAEAAKLAPKLQAVADEFKAKHTVPGVHEAPETVVAGAGAAAGDEAERQRAAKRHGVKPSELVFSGDLGYVPLTRTKVAQRELGEAVSAEQTKKREAKRTAGKAEREPEAVTGPPDAGDRELQAKHWGAKPADMQQTKYGWRPKWFGKGHSALSFTDLADMMKARKPAPGQLPLFGPTPAAPKPSGKPGPWQSIPKGKRGGQRRRKPGGGWEHRYDKPKPAAAKRGQPDQAAVAMAAVQLGNRAVAELARAGYRLHFGKQTRLPLDMELELDGIVGSAKRKVLPGMGIAIQPSAARLKRHVERQREPEQTSDAYPQAVGPMRSGQTRAQLEDAVRHEAKEHLAVFGRDGGQLVRLKGTRTNVKFTDEAMFAVLEDGAATITHNHPVPPLYSPLSAQDILAAVGCNAAEIRAVTPEGVWSLKRPDDGWEANAEVLRYGIRGARKRAKTAVHDELAKAVPPEHRDRPMAYLQGRKELRGVYDEAFGKTWHAESDKLCKQFLGAGIDWHPRAGTSPS